MKRAKINKINWKVLILPFCLFIVIASIAFAQQISIPRYRITVQDKKSEGLLGTLSDAFKRLQMSAIGVITPNTGDKFQVTAVAYSPTVDQNDASPCITASGTVVRKGVVATNFLPIGTRLKIGNEFYTVEDRMNAKYNGKKIIDIWHPTTKEALAFGKQNLEIEVLPKDYPPTPAPNPVPKKGVWEKTKDGVRGIGQFFSNHLPVRSYQKEADCSKLQEQFEETK